MWSRETGVDKIFTNNDALPFSVFGEIDYAIPVSNHCRMPNTEYS